MEDQQNYTAEYVTAESILIATTVVPSVIGTVSTVLLILIHYFYHEVWKPFTVLILSAAVGDSVHFLNCIFLEPVGILQMTPDSCSFICKMAGCVIVASHMFNGLSQTALAVDRYLLVVWRKCLTAAQRWAIVLTNFLITVVTTVPYFIQDAFGGLPGVTCVLDMRKYDFSMNSAALLIMVFFYSTTLFCSLRLMFFLKKYRDQQLSLGQQTTLRENQDLSRMILAQTIPAVVLQPSAIIIHLIDGLVDGVPQWLKYCLILCYYIHPALNSILLLYIIKPYRMAIKKMLIKKVNPAESTGIGSIGSTLPDLNLLQTEMAHAAN